MTVIVSPGTRCITCTVEQPPGTPVALIATHNGHDWHACLTCAQALEEGM